jgi:hypothetical protein
MPLPGCCLAGLYLRFVLVRALCSCNRASELARPYRFICRGRCGGAACSHGLDRKVHGHAKLTSNDLINRQLSILSQDVAFATTIARR